MQPVVELGSYPTPVSKIEVDGATLFVKRDDQTSPIYGGNKVRKLETLLASAREHKKTRLLTVGAVGSHHVLATAIHGAAHGFRVHAVLVPQPATKHAEYNIRAGYASGLTAEAATYPSLHLHVLATMTADTEYIGLGGSSVAGSIGYVQAAAELEAQVSAGILPAPDAIVVALGSGGTVAGLAAGLEKTRLAARVVAVAIARPIAIVRMMAERLTRQVAEEIGVDPEKAIARIALDATSVGRGYGYSTPEGEAAIAIAREHGLKLDPTYTGKAFAHALTLAKTEKVLFWNTLSGVDITRLAESFEARALPDEIRSLLKT